MLLIRLQAVGVPPYPIRFAFNVYCILILAFLILYEQVQFSGLVGTSTSSAYSSPTTMLRHLDSLEVHSTHHLVLNQGSVFDVRHNTTNARLELETVACVAQGRR